MDQCFKILATQKKNYSLRCCLVPHFLPVNDSRSKWVTLLGVWMDPTVINCSVNGYSPVEIHYPSAPSGISSRSRKKINTAAAVLGSSACVLRSVPTSSASLPGCHTPRRLRQRRRRLPLPRQPLSCGGASQAQDTHSDTHC